MDTMSTQKQIEFRSWGDWWRYGSRPLTKGWSDSILQLLPEYYQILALIMAPSFRRYPISASFYWITTKSVFHNSNSQRLQRTSKRFIAQSVIPHQCSQSLTVYTLTPFRSFSKIQTTRSPTPSATMKWECHHTITELNEMMIDPQKYDAQKMK